jgi:hypothetical protein
MRRGLMGLAMLFLVVSLMAPKDVGALPTDVTINLTTYFDEDNTVSNNGLAGTYGGRLAFDGNLASQSGYVFAFWIVDGNVQRGLPVDYEFLLTENMELTAVFRPTDEYAGVFMDANLNLLGVRYANTENSFTLTDNGMALPGKPGYLIANPRWNGSLTLTDDTVLTLQYEKAQAATYSVTVNNGTGTGTYDYDQVVTVSADLAGPGEYFQHWERGGQVVSTKTSYSFTVLGDTELTAVFDTTVPVLSPKVSISDTLYLRQGYTSYLGQMDVPDGYDIVEFGMLTSATVDTPVLDNGAFTKYQGGSYHPTTKEFLHSFTSSFASIRAYMVLADGVGDLTTYYSDTYDIPTAGADLFFSEYIEGSSNNKAIEIYNPTDQSIDLSAYKVYLYSNGSPTVSRTLQLTGIIASGDVYVIYNSSSVPTIQVVGDEASGVTDFNGDDTIALVKVVESVDVVLDVIGQIGTDPGSSWSANGVSTVNQTLVRKPSVTAGDANGSDAFDPSVEWDSYAQDTFTYLGSHTMTGFPLSGGGSSGGGFNPGSAPSFSGHGAASINEGDTYDPLTGVTAADAEDGDLTDNISYTVVDGASNAIANPGDFSTLPAGTYSITLQVSDSAGNRTTTSFALSINIVSSTPDLFISEYIEGSSNNKAIELYNPTGSSIDLSQYTIRINANDNQAWGSDITLSGTLASGGTYVIANSGAIAEIFALADLTTGSLTHNGDDAIGLFKDGTLIDIVGVFGEDPGSSWTVGSGSTADNTLIRSASVSTGVTTWDTTEWSVLPQDDYSNLGQHTSDFPE